MHDPRLPTILAQMRWRVRPEPFAVVGVASRERGLAVQLLARLTGPFLQFTVEPDMVTLVLPETDWHELRPAFPQARVEQHYRAISFESDLPADLVGFLALISSTLAQAQVPLLAICGFARDHVLVREGDLERALQAIEGVVKGQAG